MGGIHIVQRIPLRLKDFELAHAEVEIAYKKHMQIFKEDLVCLQNVSRKLLCLLK